MLKRLSAFTETLLIARVAPAAALAAAEIFVADGLWSIQEPQTSAPAISAVTFLARTAPLALLAFVLFSWPRRVEHAAAWVAAARTQSLPMALLANAMCFALLIVSRAALAADGAEAAPLWMALYPASIVATGASLALLIAPCTFWWRLVSSSPIEVSLACLAAILVTFMSWQAQASWYELSGATLWLAHAILSLYESDAHVDFATRELGVGDFEVLIYAPCSGYEGIALVFGFLSIYLWIFRRELRFPHALLLAPLCIVATWLLNGARIAALVSIGAHISPEVALGGFHSQAGWIAFLIVAISTMTGATKVPWLWKDKVSTLAQSHPGSTGSSDLKTSPALPLLAPYIGLASATLIASAFTPEEHWLYVLKVLGIAVPLIWLRAFYIPIFERVSGVAVAAGVGVAVAWIATEPATETPTALADWFGSLSPAVALLWLMLRGLGTAVLVPIAEELAFRGYLHSLVLKGRFERLEPAHMSVLTLVVTSVLFGLLHERWVAGALAGAVFSLLMWRTGRISDAIAAHIAANLVIFAWAVAMGQWALL